MDVPVSLEHSEAAAVLMDVSHDLALQSQGETILMSVPQKPEVDFSDQSHGSTVLMNVGEHKDISVGESVFIDLPPGSEVPVEAVIMADASDQDRAGTYVEMDVSSLEKTSLDTLSQFQVKSSDGRVHTITVTHLEETVDESGNVHVSPVIQFSSPGREPETVTVTGLVDGYNLESLAQIAEILVNREEESEMVASEPMPDVMKYETVEQPSQYIAMKQQTEAAAFKMADELKQTVQTVAIESPQGSQSLVSLAQIAELVINQGCFEDAEKNAAVHQLELEQSSVGQSHVVMSSLDSKLGNLQTISTSRRTTTGSGKYISVPMRSRNQSTSMITPSNYTTKVLPISRKNSQSSTNTSKNIYSEIRAENGECYMVVLPESGSLEPSHLRNLLSSYSRRSESGDPAESDQKPRTFSTGCQTTKTHVDGFNQTTVRLGSKYSIQAESRNLTEGLINLTEVQESDIENVLHVNPATVKIESEKYDRSEEEMVSEFVNFDNCGHESVARRESGDESKAETKSIMIQTDVTAQCYINVVPDELIRRRRKRAPFTRSRLYLDDPRRKRNPDNSEVMESPYLTRKTLLDVQNAFYICGTCDAKFSEAEELKKHSKKHKFKKVSCSKCDQVCHNLKNLADHMISHSRCKTFRCSVCSSDTVFKSAQDFKEHVNDHLGKRFFQCGSCGQKFPHVANLRVHMRVHTGEKPFQCDQCPSAFTQKASLESHISSYHNKEKKFHCEDCGVKFARRTDLRIHERKHTGERPYNCDLCNKTFISNSGLTSHKKTHFRQRFHKCNECTKSFDTPARLSRHQVFWHRGKGGDNAHKCSECGNFFSNQYELRRHMQRHSQPFTCVSCDFLSSDKGSLRGHIVDNHPELVPKLPELFMVVDSILDNTATQSAEPNVDSLLDDTLSQSAEPIVDSVSGDMPAQTAEQNVNQETRTSPGNQGQGENFRADEIHNNLKVENATAS